MNLPEAQREFAVRYYWWAKEEIKREVRENFPLLGAFKNRTGRFFPNIQSSSPDEVVVLMTALLKRTMASAITIAGDCFTEDEKQLVERYFQSPIVGSARDFELTEMELARAKGIYADRRLLRSAIKDELTPILGSRIFRRSSATWVHTTEINGWMVNTDIDTGGRYHQLSYSHYITDHEVTTLSNHPNLNEFPISVLSWLGLGGTQWSMLTPSDVPDVVKSLSAYCSLFMSVVPKLLSGLTRE